MPELGIPTHIDGAEREDIPVPPPQNRAEEQAQRPEGADDVRSDPTRAIAEELGDADRLIDPWDFSAGTDDEDDEDEDD